MTTQQTKAVKEAITEYFELQEAANKLNDLIGDRLMIKLFSTGISQEEAEEIYLETIVKHAVKNINSKSFDFLKPFIEKGEDDL